jgi:hypothetical protein
VREHRSLAKVQSTKEIAGVVVGFRWASRRRWCFRVPFAREDDGGPNYLGGLSSLPASSSSSSGSLSSSAVRPPPSSSPSKPSSWVIFHVVFCPRHLDRPLTLVNPRLSRLLHLAASTISPIDLVSSTELPPEQNADQAFRLCFFLYYSFPLDSLSVVSLIGILLTFTWTLTDRAPGFTPERLETKRNEPFPKPNDLRPHDLVIETVTKRQRPRTTWQPDVLTLETSHCSTINILGTCWSRVSSLVSFASRSRTMWM